MKRTLVKIYVLLLTSSKVVAGTWLRQDNRNDDDYPRIPLLSANREDPTRGDEYHNEREMRSVYALGYRNSNIEDNMPIHGYQNDMKINIHPIARASDVRRTKDRTTRKIHNYHDKNNIEESLLYKTQNVNADGDHEDGINNVGDKVFAGHEDGTNTVGDKVFAVNADGDHEDGINNVGDKVFTGHEDGTNNVGDKVFAGRKRFGSAVRAVALGRPLFSRGRKRAHFEAISYQNDAKDIDRAGVIPAMSGPSKNAWVKGSVYDGIEKKLNRKILNRQKLQSYSYSYSHSGNGQDFSSNYNYNYNDPNNPDNNVNYDYSYNNNNNNQNNDNHYNYNQNSNYNQDHNYNHNHNYNYNQDHNYNHNHNYNYKQNSNYNPNNNQNNHNNDNYNDYSHYYQQYVPQNNDYSQYYKQYMPNNWG